MRGGHGTAEVTERVVYFAFALRNVGHGLAVLSGWTFRSDLTPVMSERPGLDSFRRLHRALYLPPNDAGFWQGSMRDPSEDIFTDATDTINRRRPFSIDVLYGDGEGGQRVITRFSLSPQENGAWLSSVARHWNLDRADPH